MSSAKVQSSKESSAYPETLEKDNNSSLRRESLSEICIPKVPIIGDFANEDHDLSRTNTFFSPTGIMTSSPSSMSPVLSPRESVREGNANYVLTGNTSPIGNFTIQDSYSPVSPASGYPTQDFNGYPIQDHQVFPSHDIGFSSHDYNGFPLRVNNEFSPQDNNKGLGIDFLNDSSRQILFNPPPINDLSRQSSVYPPPNNDLSRQGPIYPPPNNNLSRQGSAYPSGNNDLSMPPQNNNLSRQGSAYPSGNNDLSMPPQNNNLSRQGSAYPSGNNDLSRQGSAYSPQNNNPTPQNENTANIDSGFGVCRSLCSNTRTLTDDEVKKACKEFYDIISTFNPKEDSKLIDILSKYPPIQMDQILAEYKAEYKKSLNFDVKSKTSGNFGKLCSALTQTTLDYDVWCLHNAIDRIGTDERCLIDILIGRTNKDIITMCNAYKKTYNKSLEEDIKGDTSGYFRKFLVAIVQGNRDESDNERDVQTDVEALFKAGEGRLGTDETTFITIFTNRSDAHLIKVFDKYQQIYKSSMIKAIKGEFSGDIKNSLLAHVRAIIDYNDYVADLFEKSMKGLGTRNEMLIRLVVRYRDPALMNPIKEAYNKMYKKTLKKRIENDTSGSFRTLLCKCIENCKPQ